MSDEIYIGRIYRMFLNPLVTKGHKLVFPITAFWVFYDELEYVNRNRPIYGGCYIFEDM